MNLVKNCFMAYNLFFVENNSSWISSRVVLSLTTNMQTSNNVKWIIDSVFPNNEQVKKNR